MIKKMHIVTAAVIVFIILIWSVGNLMHGVKTIDRDGDGLSDDEEQKIGTSQMDADSDNDGINDYEEYKFWNELLKKYLNETNSPFGDIDNDEIPNILDIDSDGDGISDGDEMDYWNQRYEEEGIESLKPEGDVDNDGIPNILDSDSDNDQASDGYEIDPEDGQPTDPADPDTDGDGVLDGIDNTPAGPQDPSGLTYDGSSLSQTTGPSRNGYHTEPTCIAVFDPFLAPRKRYEIYDAIYTNYNAYIYDNTPKPIELSNKKEENVFTGTINLELSSNYIRIPSVAPTAKIHSYTTYPSVNLEFYKDGADNYYVKSSTNYGKVILNFVTSADSTYWNYYIPSDLTLDDITEEKITPPLSVISKANIVIEKLGLTGEKNLKEIVSTLYKYFSGFTPGEIPSEEEEPDPYLAMALSEHGCCYVRSFACFVTANSIGVPTRLVTNECHAFVEMYIPDHGWIEVQLGGCGGSISNPNDYDPFDQGNPPPDDDDDDITDDDISDDDDDYPPWPYDNGGYFWECEPELLNTTTTISYVTPNADKPGNFNVEGYVKDQNKIGISDIQVLIFITNNKLIPGYLSGIGNTDNTGKFSIECDVPSETNIGENHVVALTLPTDVYCGSWSDPIINISSNTTLELDMVGSIGLTDNLVIKGILYDEGGKACSYKDVIINKDGEYIGTATTDYEGEFRYYYNINTLGTFDITVIFNGDTYLGSSQDSQTVTVRDKRTSLEMTVTPTTAKKGGQLSFTGTLRSVSENVLPNSEIIIYYNAKQVSATTTNSQGTFEKTINIPDDSPLGNITVKVKYPGNFQFAEAVAEKIIFVQSETQLKIDAPSKTNLEQNETIFINCTLKDSSGNPIENALIYINWPVFSVDGKTDSDGNFNISYKISPTETLGSSTITAEFNGTNVYLPSKYPKNVKIVPEGYVEEQTPQKESQNIYWLIAIAIIIIIIVGVFIMFKKQENRQGPNIQEIASRTVNQLRTENDHRKTVLNCYKEMCNWLNRQGVHKGAFQTPREFAMATKNFLRISPEGLYTLTQIFEKARYSKHNIDVEDRNNAIKCLNEIISNPVNLPVNPQPVGNPPSNISDTNPRSYP